jgi:hypothetical protein
MKRPILQAFSYNPALQMRPEARPDVALKPHDSAGFRPAGDILSPRWDGRCCDRIE